MGLLDKLTGLFSRGQPKGADGIDWSVYTPEGLDMIFLGWLYRTRHSHGDRRAQGEQPYEVDHKTGLPLTEATLAKGGAAIPGIEVALRTAQHPDKWAANLILNDNGVALWRIPRDKWTAQEARIVAELTYRWKQWALRARDKGWVEIKPPVAWEPTDGSDPRRFATGYGDDKLPYVWHATNAALAEAEKRIPGTVFAKGAISALATASEEDRQHAAKVAEWAVKEWKNEDGAGTS